MVAAAYPKNCHRMTSHGDETGVLSMLVRVDKQSLWVDPRTCIEPLEANAIEQT
jgi:hypothetical protein